MNGASIPFNRCNSHSDDDYDDNYDANSSPSSPSGPAGGPSPVSAVSSASAVSAREFVPDGLAVWRAYCDARDARAPA